MIDMELVKNTEKLLEKELRAMVDKGAITPADLDNMKKVFCVLGMIEDMQNGRPVMDDERSYGWAMHRIPDHDYSYGRARSPVTGRYISTGVGGYSGHSIEDRMIASLEQQMDSAASDYERQVIKEEINRIRMGTR